MEQSASCKANRSSDNQEIPNSLWNPKVQHRIHKSPKPMFNLSCALVLAHECSEIRANGKMTYTQTRCKKYNTNKTKMAVSWKNIILQIVLTFICFVNCITYEWKNNHTNFMFIIYFPSLFPVVPKRAITIRVAMKTIILILLYIIIIILYIL